ncbi:MAG TPA: GtrA family protein [Phenylobacterium sp.]|nr:GtrA family protein [Phenylobacterium sp.]
MAAHQTSIRSGHAPGRFRALIRAVAGEFPKYLIVSAVALAVDTGLLIGLTELGRINYLTSATIGFLAGMVVSYLLSIRFVFRERRLESRRVEFLTFLAIGLVGLGVSIAIMKVSVEHFGIGYALAKVPAAGGSFGFGFLIRRIMLFTARHGVGGI